MLILSAFVNTIRENVSARDEKVNGRAIDSFKYTHHQILGLFSNQNLEQGTCRIQSHCTLSSSFVFFGCKKGCVIEQKHVRTHKNDDEGREDRFCDQSISLLIRACVSTLWDCTGRCPKTSWKTALRDAFTLFFAWTTQVSVHTFLVHFRCLQCLAKLPSLETSALHVPLHRNLSQKSSVRDNTQKSKSVHLREVSQQVTILRLWKGKKELNGGR